jgi:hypothetical protein
MLGQGDVYQDVDWAELLVLKYDVFNEREG